MSFERGPGAIKLFHEQNPGHFMGKGHGRKADAFLEGRKNFPGRSRRSPTEKIKVLGGLGDFLGELGRIHLFAVGVQGDENGAAFLGFDESQNIPGVFL